MIGALGRSHAYPLSGERTGDAPLSFLRQVQFRRACGHLARTFAQVEGPTAAVIFERLLQDLLVCGLAN